MPLQRFWAISTAKTTRVAMTKIQNKAIGSIDPPNKKTGASFFQRNNIMPILIVSKGKVMGLIRIV
jgi:hypothetical protein